MLTLHMFLSAAAAGHRVLDPSNPLGDDFGGGSRAGFLGLVRAMGRLGKYRVTAVCTLKERKMTVDGVDYVRLDQQHKLGHADISHAFYDGGPIIGSQSRLRIWGHHTYNPMAMKHDQPMPQAWDWADVNTAPSQHALDALRGTFAPHAPWEVVPNAVEGLDGVEWAPVEEPTVIYHTSPDRGLHLLLGDVWPQVRARVPNARLRVVGDVDDIAGYDGPQRSVRGQRAAALRRGVAAATAAGGVTFLGRLTRKDLLRELTEATCFAFPCSVSAPSETWSISCHESCEIGLPLVLAPTDALGMWAPYARLTPGPAEAHLQEFTDAVVDVLSDPTEANHLSELGKRVRGMWSFDKSAAALDALIEKHLPRTAAAEAKAYEELTAAAQ